MVRTAPYTTFDTHFCCYWTFRGPFLSDPARAFCEDQSPIHKTINARFALLSATNGIYRTFVPDYSLEKPRLGNMSSPMWRMHFQSVFGRSSTTTRLIAATLFVPAGT